MGNSHLTTAEHLLLELCRSGDPEFDRVPGIQDSLPPALLNQLMALSARHGVQGLAFSKLARSEAGSNLFANLKGTVTNTLSLLTRQATIWDFEQDRVLAGLDNAGLTPLVLKGGALRKWVFEAPVERSMGDLDILVDPKEIQSYLTELKKLGYTSKYSDQARAGFQEFLYHDRVTHPNGFHVEVHWGLTRPSAFVQLDPRLFLSRALTLQDPSGRTLRVPSPEDMILHTVSQSEQDAVRALRRLVDLDRVNSSQALDWGYIVARTRENGLYPALCVTHRLANLLLGTPVPDPILRGDGVSWTSRAALAAFRPVQRLLRERVRAKVPDHYLFRLWCLPEGRQRRRWLGELARGVRDPLGWVWEEEEEGEPGTTPEAGRGLLLALKLMAYQSSVFLSAGWSAVQPGGAGNLRFWKAPDRPRLPGP